MRTIVAGICLVASSLFASSAANALPVTPPAGGQITEEAARGRRFFETGRFGEAAIVLERVVRGATGDAEGTKQIAKYELAIALYQLRFYQASGALFSEVAGQPSHARFREALPWLLMLSIELPEPAELIERVGRYNGEDLARFDNPGQRDLYWQLNYMLGRYTYRNGGYKGAIRLLEKVDAKSKHYVEAQILMGISYVQIRKPAPAAEALLRAVRALDEGAETAEDKARLRDLAFLSMARLSYSTSVRLSDKRPPPRPRRR